MKIEFLKGKQLLRTPCPRRFGDKKLQKVSVIFST